MDALTADLARHLRVADKDILSVKDHEHGHDVLLADGCRLLVTKHGDYLLSDHKTVRRIRHWDDHKHKFDKKPKPEPTPEPKPEPKKKIHLHVPEGTTDEIVDWVGDDLERAEAALDHERKKPKPRMGLIKQLDRIVDG